MVTGEAYPQVPELLRCEHALQHQLIDLVIVCGRAE
jgi:hypothetical protein